MGEVVSTTRRDAHRSFTALKFAALDAAAIDERLTHLDFRLFYYLASASDRETRVARRKQQVIADALGVTRRAVQLSAERLSVFGYIAIHTKEGGSYAHGYEIAVRKPDACARFGGAPANPASPFAKRRRTNTAKMANGSAEKGEPPFAPILPFNSLDIPLSARPMPDVVVASLRKRLGDAAFRSWFAKVTVAGVADGVVTLMAPSRFHASKIIGVFEMPLLDAWRILDPCVERIAVLAKAPGALP